MADYRYIHTKIWRDEWFSELPDDGKVLWFYLLTNPAASVCGMFRLPDKFIAFDTGIEVKRVKELKEQFKQAGKIEFENDIIWILKMRELNPNPSPLIAKCIIKDLQAIPASRIRDMYIEKYSINTVLIPTLNQTKPNLTEPNLTEPPDTGTEPDATAAAFRKVAKVYESEIGALTGMIADTLKDALTEYPAEWIESALKASAGANVRRWNYAEAILKRWKVDGFQSNKSRPNGNGSKPAKRTASEILADKLKELEANGVTD